MNYWIRLVEREGRLGAAGLALIRLGIVIFLLTLMLSLLHVLPEDTWLFAAAIWVFVIGLLLFWKTDY